MRVARDMPIQEICLGVSFSRLTSFAPANNNYTKVFTYTLYFYKNVFPAQAEYSYFLWSILG